MVGSKRLFPAHQLPLHVPLLSNSEGVEDSLLFASNGPSVTKRRRLTNSSMQCGSSSPGCFSPSDPLDQNLFDIPIDISSDVVNEKSNLSELLSLPSELDSSLISSPVLYENCPGLMASSSMSRASASPLRSPPPRAFADNPLAAIGRTRCRINRASGVVRLMDLVPISPHILPIVSSCKYCRAKRFYRECPSFCCGSGQIKIALHNAPSDLWDLFTGTDELCKEFKPFVRTYNNSLAFTSFGVTCDRNLCRRNLGIYTFKAHGQVYHSLAPLIPSGEAPKFLQLYFYDTENELANRLKASEHLNATIVSRLLVILAENPYSQFFRTLADLPSLEDCTIAIRTTTTRDQRVYNVPTTSQVAAIWIEDPHASVTGCRDILVHSKMGRPCRVQFFFGCYDSMQYPLLFAHGQPGWHQGIKRTYQGRVVDNGVEALPSIQAIGNIDDFLKAEERVMTEGRRSRAAVSCREYYSFVLQIRVEDRSVVLHSGRLLQQYVVDMYIKLESSRLGYFEHHQKRIWSELYSGILDSIAVGENRGFKIGNRIVLPATFIGGPRDMQRRYLDAMTLVQRFGKPDLFITMTCNPTWPEIKQELMPGEEPQNRPDLLARIFRAKFEELKNDLVKRKLFGPVAGYVYVIEFQKRGLPHVHMLLILKNDYKIRIPEQFDRYVTAEIPDERENPHLHRAVCRHMMHGPCGLLNPDNVCMKRTNSCKNHYPREFCEQTTQREDGYPLYRRRNNQRTANVRKHVLDNRWVIPYNEYVLAKFDCHINVEICSTLKAVKYLYKYIYKGHDRVSFNVYATNPSGDVDEISTFRDARWVAAPEAMWRIYKFHMNEIYPAVVTLQLHLEHHQPVVYADQDDLNDVLTRSLCKKTTLTEYFAMNKVNPDARKLLYVQFPQHFVWNQQAKKWTGRKQGIAVGRIVSVSPLEGERFYLKLLLNNIRGATSFDELKIVGGHVCETFMEAAVLHHLCLADDCYRACLEEACHYRMPPSLRRLFSTILVYCNPVNARLLWEEFASSFSEDYSHSGNFSQRQVFHEALKDIAHHLESMGKDINDYHLVANKIIIDESERGMKEINNELSIVVPQCDLDNVHVLNYEQRHAYDVIISRVFSEQHGAFFVDGPGGTGKSFLYTVLLGAIRSKGFIALACASSGVAASILPAGRTAHSRFKIPITTEEFLVCKVKKQSGLAKLLRAARLIIWDEAPMVRRQVIEAFECMLRDICDCQLPYGGKVVVFGGDFRQILPVIPKGSMDSTIRASLVKSPLWAGLEKFRLIDNMRARMDPYFSEFLLKVGEGQVPIVTNDEIRIPSSLVLPYTGPESLDVLIKTTFPDLECYSGSLNTVINRAILSTRNDFVQEINDTIIDKFPGELYEYRSFDNALEDSQQGLQEEFFNTITPSGFPPHILKLKKNSPVILLRNIDPSQGLCNGTRLICTSFGRNTIGAIIATGNYRGKHVFLPRIPLTPNDSERGVFPFRRTQFPIRLCFCMTINKAQGQTLDFVGIYLPQSVFCHGQLYVALSRAKVAAAVAVLIVPLEGQPDNGAFTRNVVYTEVLELASKD